MRNKTSLQDIANVLNITKVTVHRALKGQEGVSDELRKTILDKAKEMKYAYTTPIPTERPLTFVFITPSRFFLKTEHLYTDIYYYLDRLCDEKKYCLSLHIINSSMENALELPNNIQNDYISGIFVGGELSKMYLDKLIPLGIPTVVLDNFANIPQFGYITVDNYYLGYKAAIYLIERGHKNIGFLGQRNSTSNVTDRLLGVQKALIENGLDLKEEWIVENNDSRTGLYTMAFTLPDALPTAFICHYDKAAYFLVQKLQIVGLAVPRDISILSFDETETTLETIPQLTSIKINRPLFAQKAVEMMENFLSNPKESQPRVYLESELIERQSVRNLNGG